MFPALVFHNDSQTSFRDLLTELTSVQISEMPTSRKRQHEADIDQPTRKHSNSASSWSPVANAPPVLPQPDNSVQPMSGSELDRLYKPSNEAMYEPEYDFSILGQPSNEPGISGYGALDTDSIDMWAAAPVGFG